MSHYVNRRWEGNPGAPGGRRARKSFSYDAFVPDRIADLSPTLRLDVAERIFEATHSIELAATAGPEGALETVGSLLLHAEAREIAKNFKLGSYAVEVRDDQDELVAQFQGVAYRKKDPLPE